MKEWYIQSTIIQSNNRILSINLYYNLLLKKPIIPSFPFNVQTDCLIKLTKTGVK